MTALKDKRRTRSAQTAFWTGVLTGFTVPVDLFTCRAVRHSTDFDSIAYAWHSVDSALCDALAEIEDERSGQASRQKAETHTVTAAVSAHERRVVA